MNARDKLANRAALKVVEAEVVEVDDLLQTVRDLLVEARGALEGAKASGNYGHAASNIRESLRAVELMAKLKGELQSGTQVNIQTNIIAHPEWLQIRGALMQALKPYPEATQAVGKALRELKDSHYESEPGGPQGV